MFTSPGQRRALTLLCAILPLCAAPQKGAQKTEVPFEIAGRVTELGFNRGLSGVEVTLERYDGEYTSSLTPRKMVAKEETGDAGGFRFTLPEPGFYRVSVRKEGYSPAGSVLDGFISGVSVSLDKVHPKRELAFQLARPAQLTGVVIDKETQEPVQSIRVHVQGYGYQRGRVFLMPGNSAFTDDKGHFTVSGLTPGDYVIALGPRMHSALELERSPELRASGENRMLTKFKEADLSATDLDYDWSYWPGGAGLDAALPLTLGSGAELDAGRLQIRKSTMQRARVQIPESSCPPNETVSVHLRRLSNPWIGTSVGQPACGSGFLIRGLPPGDYRLELSAPGVSATKEFHIADRNTELTVPLERSVSLEGRVRTEGATPLDPTQLTLLLKPLSWAVRNPPVQVDSAGRFHAERVAVRDYRLLINGMPQSHCLRGLVYNGTRLDGDILALNPYALEHKLELIIDDQAATLSGTVSKGSRLVSNPWVVLARWPPGTDLFDSLQSTSGDEDGRFSFQGLAPGDYRLVAVPQESKRELDRPNILEQLLRSAPNLPLSGKQTQTVPMKLSTPVRF